jgi:hypothetical protein
VADSQSQYQAPVLLSYSCPLKWEDMSGDENVRDCSHCACKVQNISDYSADQLAELYSRIDRGERICVAFRVPLGKPESVTTNSEMFKQPLQPLTLTRRRKPAPVMIAASIGLICWTTLSNCTPAFADECIAIPNYLGNVTGIWCDPLKISVPDNSSVQNETVALAPDERETYRVDVGWPSRNAVRKLIVQALDVASTEHTPESEKLHNEIRSEQSAGTISVSKVEKLATMYCQSGSAADARALYTVLIALVDREHPDAMRLQFWHEQELTLVPVEFKTYLRMFDKNVAEGKYESASWVAGLALRLRHQYPSVADHCPWSDISWRLAKSVKRAPYTAPGLEPYFVLMASEKEGDSQENEEWRASMRKVALGYVDFQIKKGEDEIKAQDYLQALDTLGSLDMYANDTKLAGQIAWSRIFSRVSTLAPLVPANMKDVCLCDLKRLAEVIDRNSGPGKGMQDLREIIEEEVNKDFAEFDKTVKTQPDKAYDSIQAAMQSWQIASEKDTRITWDDFLGRYLQLAQGTVSYAKVRGWEILFQHAQKLDQGSAARFHIGWLRPLLLKSIASQLQQIDRCMSNGSYKDAGGQITILQYCRAIDPEVQHKSNWVEIASRKYKLIGKYRANCDLGDLWSFILEQAPGKARDEWLGKARALAVSDFRRSLADCDIFLSAKRWSKACDSLERAMCARDIDPSVGARCSLAPVRKRAALLFTRISGERRKSLEACLKGGN